MHPKINVLQQEQTNTHDNDFIVYADAQVTALQCYV